MRLLVIDSSCNTRHQRTPGVLPPDVLQPFLRRCRLLGHFDDIANRRAILPDIYAALPERGTGAVEVPVLPTIDAGGGVRWDPISMQALPSYPNIYPN